jgi:hypothetical protein
LGNGDGTFGPFISILNGGVIWDADPILIADMNGDGRPDILFPYIDTTVPATGAFNGYAVLLNTTPMTPDFTIGAASGSSSSTFFEMMLGLVREQGSWSKQAVAARAALPSASTIRLAAVTHLFSYVGRDKYHFLLRLQEAHRLR